jgi:hypothetical protein
MCMCCLLLLLRALHHRAHCLSLMRKPSHWPSELVLLLMRTLHVAQSLTESSTFMLVRSHSKTTRAWQL